MISLLRNLADFGVKMIRDFLRNLAYWIPGGIAVLGWFFAIGLTAERESVLLVAPFLLLAIVGSIGLVSKWLVTRSDSLTPPTLVLGTITAKYHLHHGDKLSDDHVRELSVMDSYPVTQLIKLSGYEFKVSRDDYDRCRIGDQTVLAVQHGPRFQNPRARILQRYDKRYEELTAIPVSEYVRLGGQTYSDKQ